MGQLWIEYTGSDGDEGSARWGNVTDEQIDTILAATVAALGQPHTIA